MNIWVSDWGTYFLPERFLSLKFTKTGWFDKRRKSDYYAELKKWIEEQDAIEIAEALKH